MKKDESAKENINKISPSHEKKNAVHADFNITGGKLLAFRMKKPLIQIIISGLDKKFIHPGPVRDPAEIRINGK